MTYSARNCSRTPKIRRFSQRSSIFCDRANLKTLLKDNRQQRGLCF
ncbi:MAG: hypothetical protein GVY04_09745 [Cyanobacteria bacterium]|nr:hypothetical protein [Cyanobacteria bacterium GSL.Bin1]